MRYRLRTLMIPLAVLPPVIACGFCAVRWMAQQTSEQIEFRVVAFIFAGIWTAAYLGAVYAVSRWQRGRERKGKAH